MLQIWTVDDAEELKEKLQSKPLDEYSMGGMEEDIRKFAIMMRSTQPKVRGILNNECRQLIANYNMLVLGLNRCQQ